MPKFEFPGVYVEEVEGKPKPIDGVPTGAEDEQAAARRRRWPYRIAIGGIVLAGLALVAIAIAWFVGIGTPGRMYLPRPFNSEQWKAADGSTNLRCSMVADLRHRVGLVGKTEPEVVSMLGEDDDTSGPPRVYALCPSFMDVYILEIEWRNGRVASTRVRDT